ncbi:PQQ-binding-like beta-propeller repeat protein [Streptomyces sp. NPDC059894]|uniref:outer membrane protein assembly factor BamB family protein n=1 Tax=unclassified Streptomyces TaxID=2593676 RepID=UPI003656483E
MAPDTAAKDRAAGSAAGAGMSVRELRLRLDDALRGHSEVQRALRDNQDTIRVLEATITSLQDRCARLEAERDRALRQARSVTAAERDLEAFGATLARAEQRLELAFRDRGAAEVLLTTVRHRAESHRRELQALHQGASVAPGPEESSGGAEEPPGEPDAAPHRPPQQWEYELLLEAVDDRRATRCERLAEVRQRMGIVEPADVLAGSARVVEGSVRVVRRDGAGDGPDDSPAGAGAVAATEAGGTEAEAPPSPPSASPASSRAGRLWRTVSARVVAGSVLPFRRGPDGDGRTAGGGRRGPGRPGGLRAVRAGRLRELSVVVLLGLTITTAAPPTQAPPSSDTDTTDTGTATETGKVRDTEPAPALLWKDGLALGAGLGPATAGTQFVLDDDAVQAVDTTTGATRWSEPAPEAGGGSLTADATTLYVTDDLATVQARDSSTGARRWTRDLSDVLPDAGGGAALTAGMDEPVRSDTVPDTLYVTMWRWYSWTITTQGSHTGSGSRRGGVRVASDVRPALCVTSSVCRSDTRHGFPTFIGGYVTAALDTRTGTVRWHTGGRFLAEAGTLCLTTSDEGTQGVDCRTGVPRWGIDTDCESAVSDERHTLAACLADGQVHGIDPADGEELWRAGPFPGPLSDPAVSNGLVRFTAADGRLYAVDLSAGGLRWSEPAGRAKSVPVPDRDLVHVAGDDGRLYAFDSATGTRVWSAPAGGSITAGPQVQGDTVYVGAEDGRVYALDRADGTRRWSAAAGGGAVTGLHAASGHVTTLTDRHIVHLR